LNLCILQDLKLRNVQFDSIAVELVREEVALRSLHIDAGYEVMRNVGTVQQAQILHRQELMQEVLKQSPDTLGHLGITAQWWHLIEITGSELDRFLTLVAKVASLTLTYPPPRVYYTQNWAYLATDRLMQVKLRLPYLTKFSFDITFATFIVSPTHPFSDLMSHAISRIIVN
jgi:hypothetical protein